MSVRKRRWTTAKGEKREAWLVDYRDSHGDRCSETFERKKDADARQAEIAVDLRAGVHVAHSKSETVGEASEDWLAASRELERSTVKQYREHVDYHIVPFIGGLKLSELNAPAVRRFELKLRDEGRSPAMVRKILRSLGSILSDAQELGNAQRNPVRELHRRRGQRGRGKEKRQKLKVGVD